MARNGMGRAAGRITWSVGGDRMGRKAAELGHSSSFLDPQSGREHPLEELTPERRRELLERLRGRVGEALAGYYAIHPGEFPP